MPKAFSHLLSPYTIGKVTFKNRIFAAPHSIPCCYDGWKSHVKLSYQGLCFFLEKARGGAGCVTVGEIDVSDDFFQKSDDHQLRSFTTLAHGIKNYGAVASLELGYRGSKDYSDKSAGAVVWGPSPATNPHAGVERGEAMITAMTEPEMFEVAERYARAADAARMCGFDMIMIHGGHGFTLSQFISPLYNKRTDAYGGSTLGRARFPLMVLKSIRDRVGDDLLIEYRINADEVVPDGLHVDEVAQICELLGEYVDVIHATAGSYQQGEDNNMNTSVYKGRTPNLGYAAALKAKISLPLITVGAYSDPYEADTVIADGKADFICFSRQMLADAQMPNKLIDGEPEEVNVCVRCSGCMSSPPPELYAKCTVNPTANYEFIYPPVITPAAKPKKVLVIGGGAAGMTAAVTAFDRGHKVTLVEMSDRLGGIINFADSDFYKERIARWKAGMIKKVMNRDIDVRLGLSADAALIEHEAPDAVIIAVGSVKVSPPIQGLENAIHVLDMYSAAPETIGKRVVMVGGGLAGCEAALSLQAQGHEVTVIEMLDEFAPDAYPIARAAMLENLNSRVECLSSHRCLEIMSDGVRTVGKDGTERIIHADAVVYALGMKSRATGELYAAAPKRCTIVGDCVKPAKLKEAIHTAYFAAMEI